MSFHDINSKNNTKQANIAKGFIILKAKIKLGSLCFQIANRTAK